MKTKTVWRISVIVVAVAFLTSTVAFATPSNQTTVIFPPEYHQPGPYRAAALPREAATSGEGAINAQAIALGKPGTAFRYNSTFGHSTVGYLQDELHINGAVGITLDPDGNVYIAEERAARLSKYLPDGTLVWQSGGAAFHDWGANRLNWPRDVLYADNTLIIADQDQISAWSADTGEFLFRYPEQPWLVSDDFTFFQMMGFAIDVNLHLYVSDSARHRVQVFDLVPGIGVLPRATIGVTDQPGTGTGHFNNPAQIEFLDGSLYVADEGNFRVQKCLPNADFSDWDCQTFYGGTQGSGANQLDGARGLAHSADGDLYIVDNGNGRIFMCTLPAGTCSVYLQGLNWPADLAFRANGNALVSIYNDYVIAEYGADKSFVGIFKGVQGEPYLTDNNHYDQPVGVDLDSKGNLYILEQEGARLTKLSSAGAVLWQTGVPGSPVGDPAQHINYGVGLAVDKTGQKIYLAEGEYTVRVYSAVNGAYINDFGDGWGVGDYQFKDARGIAFDTYGNLYISDARNQRVMKFDKAGLFKYQLGITGVAARDNAHFASPEGITTDRSGNVYVADRDNCRVQKFSKTGVFIATIGTGMCGDRFDRMDGPVGVAVDSKGNIYVAEENNSRVNVYSTTGAYLTTIGGDWSEASGGMRNPTDVAVDAKGNLYVADKTNNRVQKYAPGVPYFAQVSLNGFGARINAGVTSMSFFKKVLFAGTVTSDGSGGQLWRLGKYGWEQIIPDGFEDPGNTAISSLLEYKGYLYAGTFNCSGEDCSDPVGGQLWRSSDGYTWSPVTLDGFSTPANTEIVSLRILGGRKICAQTADWFTGSGAEIYCSLTGDPDTWELLAAEGLGDGNNQAFGGWAEYNGVLYVGTSNPVSGAQIWRYRSVGGWQQVDAAFDSEANSAIRSLAVYKGYLYMGTENTSGMELWRCQTCAGDDWVQVGVNGFGNPDNLALETLKIAKNVLYAFMRGPQGMEIWKTADGLTWKKFGLTGMGSHINSGVHGDGDVLLTTAGDFYLGMDPLIPVNAGAVWKFCPAKSVCR